MMDDYSMLAQLVAARFGDRLGDRLRSVFVRGSVARGDAIWGVSDLDIVLWFDEPTAADNRLKGDVQRELELMPGGRAVVLQRLDDQRLDRMDEATRVYWSVSGRYDSQLIQGVPPTALLPTLPSSRRVAELLTPIMIDAGDQLLTQAVLTRAETRRLAKRTLNLVSMPAVASGLGPHFPPRTVPALEVPSEIRAMLPALLSWYDSAPHLADPAGLRGAWAEAKRWARAHGL